MTTIEGIEKAVADLPPKEFAAFRAWFESFDAQRFDEKIERDALSDRFDRLTGQALHRLASFEMGTEGRA